MTNSFILILLVSMLSRFASLLRELWWGPQVGTLPQLEHCLCFIPSSSYQLPLTRQCYLLAFSRAFCFFCSLWLVQTANASWTLSHLGFVACMHAYARCLTSEPPMVTWFWCRIIITAILVITITRIISTLMILIFFAHDKPADNSDELTSPLFLFGSEDSCGGLLRERHKAKLCKFNLSVASVLAWVLLFSRRACPS